MEPRNLGASGLKVPVLRLGAMTFGEPTRAALRKIRFGSSSVVAARRRLLSGKYERNAPPPKGVRLEKWKDRFAGYDSDRGWKTIDMVKAIAKEKETTCSAVSLAWLLANQVKRLDDASAFDIGYPYTMIGNIQKRW